MQLCKELYRKGDKSIKDEKKHYCPQTLRILKYQMYSVYSHMRRSYINQLIKCGGSKLMHKEIAKGL